MVMPVPAAMDFNFDSACSSPYMTAPSSPQRFGNFLCSAPASPSRPFRDFNHHSSSPVSSSSTKIFNVQEQHDNKKNNNDDDYDEDFEFNFSGQLERTSLSADELFDGGKIKPLKPLPTGLDSSSGTTSRSKLSQEKDPEQSGKSAAALQDMQQRGRERMSSSPSSASSSFRKGTRSLSPMRVSDIIYEQDDNSQAENIINSTTGTPKSYAASILSAISLSKHYRKWKLKDLLLFRSASEGRATSGDPLRKYAVLSKNKETEDVKNASFRSTDSAGSVSRRRGPVSAHELHYTANRAVSEEMRRKTFLPYKQGLLGCLGFNPGGVHDISRSVGR